MHGLIDIGANLAHDSFDRDRDEVLQRAWDAGLSAIVVTGSSRASSLKARELAHAHPRRLFATAGLHPHHATDWSDDFAALLRELAADPVVVALGECGLDYFRNLSPQAAQRAAFVAQLELAAQTRKPLFLHQRDAHADFIAILREHRARLAQVCVHCFTDTRAALEDCLRLDCHIGITGWICDQRRGRPLYELAGMIPEDRLLVETDAPYLRPAAAGGGSAGSRADARRNEPAFLPWVVRTLAEARGAGADELAAVTARNAQHFFRLPTG